MLISSLPQVPNLFETKLLVIAGQSEPNEFICPPITLIDGECWTTGALSIQGSESEACSLFLLSQMDFHITCEYFSIWHGWGFDLWASPLQGIFYLEMLTCTKLPIRLNHLSPAIPYQPMADFKVKHWAGAALTWFEGNLIKLYNSQYGGNVALRMKQMDDTHICHLVL